MLLILLGTPPSDGAQWYSQCLIRSLALPAKQIAL